MEGVRRGKSGRERGKAERKVGNGRGG